MPTTTHVRITQDELITEANLRFGGDPYDIAFTCPTCGDTATLREWKAIGDAGRGGQDCIGRATLALREAAGIPPDRGCDWAAYGLFRGPWEIVVEANEDTPAKSIWAFPLAGDPHPDGPVAALAKPDHSPGAANVLPGITCTIPGHCDGDNSSPLAGGAS